MMWLGDYIGFLVYKGVSKMKNIKNILKNNGLISIVAFLVAIFMVNSFAMRMTEMGKKAAKKYAMKMQPQWQAQQLQKEREKQYQPGKYFIYEQGTSNGILVDVAMVKENCKSIKLMVEDLGTEPN